MDFLKGCKDNQFDLAIVDPPYGIGMDGGKRQYNVYIKKSWASEPPKKEYFKQLFRVSKNQIIWGSTHFIENFAINSKCWIVWDKTLHGISFSDCELSCVKF